MPQLAPERIFELESVFVQVKSIDVVAQTFSAHYYIEMRVRKGQLDTDFWKLGEDKKCVNTMTHGEVEGRKVVPSVMWYLENQMHWTNAITSEIKECKVIPAKNNKEDLTCIVRIEGDFREEMDLFDFPMDCQNLTLRFEFQCALKTSPFPVNFVKAPDLEVVVDHEAFVLRNTWDLEHEVDVETFTHQGIRQAGVTNVYPAMSVSVRVHRLGTFYIYNVVLPMGMFSLFGVLAPFSIMHHESSSRLGIALSLVLTVTAYKFAISNMVPAVSYLTLMDRYILKEALIIALITIQNCLVGLPSGPIGDLFPSFTVSTKVDVILLLCILFLWVVFQIRTAWVWRKTYLKRHPALKLTSEHSEYESLA